MMMDHHRFIKPGSRSSETADEFDPIDPATIDDSLLSSPDIFDDRINMDFDAIMASDLDTSIPPSSSYAAGKSGGFSSDNSVNSDAYFEKLVNRELAETSDLIDSGDSQEDNKIGIASKVGDIGDELDLALLVDTISTNIADTTSASTKPVPVVVSGENSMRELHNQDMQESSEGADDDLFRMYPGSQGNRKDNSDTSVEKSFEQLINDPIINFDNHKPRQTTSSGDDNNTRNNGKKNDSNTTNINLSLKNSGDSVGSLCDSIGSLPSISGVGNLLSNASFQGMQQSRLQHQQQQNALLMQQQQILLEQKKEMLQQQMQGSNGSNKQKNDIRSIVNSQLSQLPQANNLSNLGARGLERRKQELIQKLEEIERAGRMNNMGMQQQQHPNQQQLILKQQMLLQQQQNQQRQLQQLQQQQQQNMRIQGQNQSQGQQQQQQQQANMGFGMNQQMTQQQQQGGTAPGLMSPRPLAMPLSQTSFSAMNNGNNNPIDNSGQQHQQSSIFASTAGNGSNSNMNNNNNQMKGNVSSVMGSKGKETPLMNFLRDKSGVNNQRNMMSMTGQQQQRMSAQVGFASLNNTNRTLGSDGSSILDASPMALSGNPLLRKQMNMMNNLDRSVNPGNRRGVHGITGSDTSFESRRSIIQSMGQSTTDILTSNSSSDFYESAGIVNRHSSADNAIAPARRGLSAGAAKAQNRRHQLRRSSNSASSFGNVSRVGGCGSSTRSLPCRSGATSSSRSLSSDDSTGSLLAIKARTQRRGSGVKHKLGCSGGSARRLSYQTLSGSAAALQQQVEDEQQRRPQQNHGWP